MFNGGELLRRIVSNCRDVKSARGFRYVSSVEFKLLFIVFPNVRARFPDSTVAPRQTVFDLTEERQHISLPGFSTVSATAKLTFALDGGQVHVK